MDLSEGHLRLPLSLFFRDLRVDEVRDRHLDGGKRRPQVVTERRQDRRGELRPLALQLRRLSFLEEVRSLDGDGGDTGERVERPRIHARTGRAQEPIGRVPIRSGTTCSVTPSGPSLV